AAALARRRAAGKLDGSRSPGGRSKEALVTESTQEPREAWSEVGRRFDELGRALRGHFGKEHDAAAAAAGTPTETTAAAEPGGAEPGGTSEAADRAAMQDALRRLGEAAQRLGDQAGEAVHDPAVRESAQRVARTFADALATTFSEFGEELRGR